MDQGAWAGFARAGRQYKCQTAPGPARDTAMRCRPSRPSYGLSLTARLHDFTGISVSIVEWVIEIIAKPGLFRMPVVAPGCYNCGSFQSTISQVANATGTA